jgi:Zinc-binding dehydrogenase
VPAVLLFHGDGGSARDMEAGSGLSELAGRVAAVAAVAPALFTEPVESRSSRVVPLLAVHGTADEVLPYGGRGASVASPLPLPALPAWLAEWATRDGCPGDPAVFLDTAEVTGVRWTGCRDGAVGRAQVSDEEAAERGVRLLGRPRPTAQQARMATGRALTEAAAGRLRPLIGQRFPLERAADAHAAIEVRATVGKTLLEVRPPVR